MTDRALFAAFLLAVPHTSFLLLYLKEAIGSGPMLRDWYVFKLAAERFVSGQLQSVYPADFYTPDHRFLYPPYALWFFAPMAWLSDVAAFWTFVAVQVGAIGASVALAARALPADRRILVAVLVGVLASAPFAYLVLLGQNAGVFLLALTLAALLLDRRPALAGAALVVLAIKPQWVLAPLGLLLLFERKAFVGLALSLAGLLASSFAGGTHLWSRFHAMAAAQVHYTSDEKGGLHNIALRGTLMGALGPGHGGIVDAVWAAGVLLVTPLLLFGWTRPVSSWRKLSMTTLYVVSMNLYVNGYDALVLILPLLDLLFGPDRLPATRRNVLLALIAAWWLADQVCYVYPVLLRTPAPPFATGGLLAIVWLLVLCHDAATRERR